MRVEGQRGQAPVTTINPTVDIAGLIAPDLIVGQMSQLGGDDRGDGCLFAGHAGRADEPLGEIHAIIEQNIPVHGLSLPGKPDDGSDVQHRLGHER